MKVTLKPLVISTFGIVPKITGKKTGRLGNKRTSGDHSDFSIVMIGQNTEKSPADLLMIKLLSLKLISLCHCEKLSNR